MFSFRSGAAGGPLPRQSASTACNIPLSMGIPAVCFGLYSGCGAHTRQEYLLLDSLPVGLRIGGRLMGEFFR